MSYNCLSAEEGSMHQISLRQANQHLSRYVKTVELGEELVITRRGKPVARLVPVAAQRQLSPEQLAALERTRERMRRGYDLGGRMPSRDELHER
jgi:prevent-host-death family protein